MEENTVVEVVSTEVAIVKEDGKFKKFVNGTKKVAKKAKPFVLTALAASAVTVVGLIVLATKSEKSEEPDTSVEVDDDVIEGYTVEKDETPVVFIEDEPQEN